MKVLELSIFECLYWSCRCLIKCEGDCDRNRDLGKNWFICYKIKSKILSDAMCSTSADMLNTDLIFFFFIISLILKYNWKKKNLFLQSIHPKVFYLHIYIFPNGNNISWLSTFHNHTEASENIIHIVFLSTFPNWNVQLIFNKINE